VSCGEYVLVEVTKEDGGFCAVKSKGQLVEKAGVVSQGREGWGAIEG